MEKFSVLPKAEDIRAARSFLNWNQAELAYKCKVNITTINAIENEKSKPSKNLIEKIAGVFYNQGIKFHSEGGFKVKKNIIKTYEGRAGYLEILKDIAEICGPNKDEFLLLGSDEKRSNGAVNEMHKKMYKMGIPYKTLMDKNSDYILGPLQDYRKVHKDLFFSGDVVLVYKDKITFTAEMEGDIENFILTKLTYIVIENAGMAEQLREYFYRLWKKGEIPTKSSTKQIFFKA
ncbi:helix-turn-helix domain-containing protein [Pseudomonadota bacterium]